MLTKLTGTESEIAAYEFTTLTCIPGNVIYKGAKIQVLDLPGIIEGAKDGKGRGRQVIAVAKTCDLILIALDAVKPLTHKRLIEYELEGILDFISITIPFFFFLFVLFIIFFFFAGFGIRLNKVKPKISFTKKDKGGISFTHTVTPTKIDYETVKAICHEYRIPSANIVFHEDCTEDQLIDVIEGNRAYIPCLYVLNKIDAITMEELEIISKIPHYVPICANLEWNFDELLEKIWSYLDLIRV